MAVKVDRWALRLIDANLNRAREGIRVVEDTARFVWRNEKLYKDLRAIRHDLHEATSSAYKKLVLARDSEKDAGRIIHEPARSTVADLVSANLRRAEEATRVLEEYSKVFSPSFHGRIKSIRFRLYDAEKAVVRKISK